MSLNIILLALQVLMIGYPRNQIADPQLIDIETFFNKLFNKKHPRNFIEKLSFTEKDSAIPFQFVDSINNVYQFKYITSYQKNRINSETISLERICLEKKTRDTLQFKINRENRIIITEELSLSLFKYEEIVLVRTGKYFLMRNLTQQSLKWLFAANAIGSIQAKYILDEIYFRGEMPGFTFSDLLKRAKSGDSQSLIVFQDFLVRNGRQDELILWLEEFSNNGSVNAMIELGKLYDPRKITFLSGTLPIGYTPKASLYWFKKAAQEKSGYAAFRIGEIYLAEEDLDSVWFWYNKAITLGYDEANLNLGSLYLDCKVPNHSYDCNHMKKKGIELLLLGAEASPQEGYYLLGLLYLDGEHVEKNIPLAKRYFRIADQNGSKLAKSKLRQLEEK